MHVDFSDKPGAAFGPLRHDVLMRDPLRIRVVGLPDGRFDLDPKPGVMRGLVGPAAAGRIGIAVMGDVDTVDTHDLQILAEIGKQGIPASPHAWAVSFVDRTQGLFRLATMSQQADGAALVEKYHSYR